MKAGWVGVTILCLAVLGSSASPGGLNGQSDDPNDPRNTGSVELNLGIAELMDVLGSKSATQEIKAQACVQLGALRAQVAVNLLADHITISDTQFLKELLPLRDLYPCLRALVEIRDPAREE